MSGTLILIPTPIDNENLLNPKTYEILKNAHESANTKIIVEEHKAARRRWLHWGLEKSAIEDFVLYNEHSNDQDLESLITFLKAGYDITLMSDAGLPAFCDPGQQLVKRCHQEKVKVTSAPFENSVSLALALSGIDHRQFHFAGFLPKEKAELSAQLSSYLKNDMTTILMDTPYRLKKTLDLIYTQTKKLGIERELFLAMDLNKTEEKTLLTSTYKIEKLDYNKREFIIILGNKL